MMDETFFKHGTKRGGVLTKLTDWNVMMSMYWYRHRTQYAGIWKYMPPSEKCSSL